MIWVNNPSTTIIVDTGPLVASLNPDDPHHSWSVKQIRKLNAPFLTCEVVLTETFHLLFRRSYNGTEKFLELLNSNLLTIDFNLMSERETLSRLIHKYRDLPMSLADACLVRMAEMNRGARVFTLDQHFRIYKTPSRRQVPVILPD